MNGVWDALGQRHFDKDQRLIRHGGVKEGKEPAVHRVQTAAQIIPTVDGMDRLIGDDLFQNIRRAFPSDGAQHQKAPVEPALQKVSQIKVDQRQIGIGLGKAQKIMTHGHELPGRPRHLIEPAGKFLAWRLGGLHEAGVAGFVGGRLIGIEGSAQFCRIYIQIAAQMGEESNLACIVKPGVAV